MDSITSATLDLICVVITLSISLGYKYSRPSWKGVPLVGLLLPIFGTGLASSSVDMRRKLDAECHRLMKQSASDGIWKVAVDGGDCRQFAYCVGPKAQRAICPFGFRFNKKLQECDLDIHVPCDHSTSTSPEPHCPDEACGVYPVAEDCSSFTICSDGKAETRECGDGLMFDKKNACCVPNNEENKDVCMMKSKNAVFNYGVKFINIDEHHDLLKCQHHHLNKYCSRFWKNALGKRAHPTDCQQFLYCYHGNATIMSCPTGLVFNEKSGNCDYASHVHNCKHPSVVEEDCVSRPCGVYALADCGKYAICHDGEYVEIKCPNGTKFDTKTDECQPEEQSTCWSIPDPSHFAPPILSERLIEEHDEVKIDESDFTHVYTANLHTVKICKGTKHFMHEPHKMEANANVLMSANVTSFGHWAGWKECPEGTFAKGVQTFRRMIVTNKVSKTKKEEHVDHAGLTSLGLICLTPEEWEEEKAIVSFVAPNLPARPWATLPFYNCTSGPTIGFHLNQAGYQSGEGADNLGTDMIKMICPCGPPAEKSYQNPEHREMSGIRGDWTGERVCQPYQAICGLQTQLHEWKEPADLKVYDNTGVNNVNMKCCNVPSPTFKYKPNEVNASIATLDNSGSDEDKYIDFEFFTGLTYSADPKWEKAIQFYESIGYTLSSLRNSVKNCTLYKLPCLHANRCVYSMYSSSDSWPIWNAPVKRMVSILVHKREVIKVSQVVVEMGPYYIQTNAILLKTKNQENVQTNLQLKMVEDSSVAISEDISNLNFIRYTPNLTPPMGCHYIDRKATKPLSTDEGGSVLVNKKLISEQGTWNEMKQCSKGKYVVGITGFRMVVRTKSSKVETKTDHAGLTSIAFQCKTPGDEEREILSAVTPGASPEPNWNSTKFFFCEEGAAMGIDVNVGNETDGADDLIGTDNVKLLCSCGPHAMKPFVNVTQQSLFGTRGIWTGHRYCAKHQALCGFQAQMHEFKEMSSKTYDNTAINAIRVRCCNVPAPWTDFKFVESRQLLLTAIHISSGGVNAKYNLEYQFGIQPNASERDERASNFYESVGYNFDTIRHKIHELSKSCKNCDYNWASAGPRIFDRVRMRQGSLKLKTTHKVKFFQVVAHVGPYVVKTNRIILRVYGDKVEEHVVKFEESEKHLERNKNQMGRTISGVDDFELGDDVCAFVEKNGTHPVQTGENGGIVASKKTPSGGVWGEMQQCPKGMYVVGVTGHRKLVTGTHKEVDDAGMVSLAVRCKRFDKKGSAVLNFSALSNVPQGANVWKDETFFECDKGAAVGFEMNAISPMKLHGDETGNDNVRLLCGCGPLKQIEFKTIPKYLSGVRGEWTGKRYCNNRQAICGLQAEMHEFKEVYDKKYDNTGLNGIRVKCCNVPNPLDGKMIIESQRRLRVAAWNATEKQKMVTTLELHVGTTVETLSDLEEDLATLYESVGYQIPLLRTQLQQNMSQFVENESETRYKWCSTHPTHEKIFTEVTTRKRLVTIGTGADSIKFFQVVGRIGHVLIRTNMFVVTASFGDNSMKEEIVLDDTTETIHLFTRGPNVGESEESKSFPAPQFLTTTAAPVTTTSSPDDEDVEEPEENEEDDGSSCTYKDVKHKSAKPMEIYSFGHVIGSRNVTSKGKWGTVKQCPGGEYVVGVTGFRSAVAGDKGQVDHAGLTSVGFLCRAPGKWVDTLITSTAPGVQAEPDWSGATVNSCRRGGAIGFGVANDLHVPHVQDHLGADDVKLICGCGSNPMISYDTKSGSVGHRGSYTGVRYCNKKQAICGLQTQMHEFKATYDKTYDNTGIAGFRVLCCDIPCPTLDWKLIEGLERLDVTDTEGGSKLVKVPIGTKIQDTESAEGIADFYESIGYTKSKLREKLKLNISQISHGKRNYNWSSSPTNIFGDISTHKEIFRISSQASRVEVYQIIATYGYFVIRTNSYVVSTYFRTKKRKEKVISLDFDEYDTKKTRSNVSYDGEASGEIESGDTFITPETDGESPRRKGQGRFFEGDFGDDDEETLPNEHTTQSSLNFEDGDDEDVEEVNDTENEEIRTIYTSGEKPVKVCGHSKWFMHQPQKLETNGSILKSPNVTSFGNWSEWKTCPEGWFVRGMQHYRRMMTTKMDIFNTSEHFVDHAGMTSLALICFTPEEWQTEEKKIIGFVSPNLPQRLWETLPFYKCDVGPAVGFQLNQVPLKLDGDNIGTDKIKLKCGCGPNVEKPDHQLELKGVPGARGVWTDVRLCQPRQALCGLRTQLHDWIETVDLEAHDNTGVNGVHMKCCNVLSPVHKYDPIETTTHISILDNSNSSQDTYFELSIDIGLSYSDDEIWEKAIQFYETVGYSLNSMSRSMKSMVASKLACMQTKVGNCLYDKYDSTSELAWTIWLPVTSKTTTILVQKHEKISVSQIMVTAGPYLIKTNGLIVTTIGGKIDSDSKKMVTVTDTIVIVDEDTYTLNFMRKRIRSLGYLSAFPYVRRKATKPLSRDDTGSIITNKKVVTELGNWMTMQQCPVGMYVVGITGFRRVVLKSWKSGVQVMDHAGMTSLSLYCQTPGDNDRKVVSALVPGAKGEPDWSNSKYFFCSEGVAIGFDVNIGNEWEATENVDLMKTDNVKLLCSGGQYAMKPFINVTHTALLGIRGVWTGERYCGKRQAICGMQPQMHEYVETEQDYDNTALNGLRIRCCNVPPPSTTWFLSERRQLLVKVVNISSTEDATYKLLVPIGIQVNSSERDERLATFYESVGYSMQKLRSKVKSNIREMAKTCSNCSFNWKTAKSRNFENMDVITIRVKLVKGKVIKFYQVVGHVGHLVIHTDRVIMAVYDEGKVDETVLPDDDDDLEIDQEEKHVVRFGPGCCSYRAKNVTKPVQVNENGGIIESVPGPSNGTWMDMQLCPDGMYAVGVSGQRHMTKMSLTGVVDDAGMSTVAFLCKRFGGKDVSFLSFATADDGQDLEPKWTRDDFYECSCGAGVGFQLNVIPTKENNGDNTGTDNVKMICSCGPSQVNEFTDVVPKSLSGIRGKWTGKRHCDKRQAICGLQAQMHPFIHSHDATYDNTGLNGVRVQCCDVHSPVSEWKIEEGRELLMKIDKNSITKGQQVTLNIPVGAQITLNEDSEELAAFYESIGYSYQSILKELKEDISEMSLRGSNQYTWTTPNAKLFEDMTRFRRTVTIGSNGDSIEFYQIVATIGFMTIRTNMYMAVREMANGVKKEILSFDMQNPDEHLQVFEQDSNSTTTEELIVESETTKLISSYEESQVNYGYRRVGQKGYSDILSLNQELDTMYKIYTDQCPVKNRTRVIKSLETTKNGAIIGSSMSQKGNWMQMKHCPVGGYVVGVSGVRSHVVGESTDVDHAGMTSLVFACKTPGQEDTSLLTFTAPGVTPKPDWSNEKFYYCLAGAAIGFEINVAKKVDKFDDLGTDNVRLICSCGPNQFKPFDESHTQDLKPTNGKFLGERHCGKRKVICGLQAQMHQFNNTYDPKYDNTGLNGIRVECCNVPSPVPTWNIEETRELLASVDSKDAKGKTLRFTIPVGMRLDASESSVDQANFYSSIGYSFNDMRQRLQMRIEDIAKNDEKLIYDWKTPSGHIFGNMAPQTEYVVLSENVKELKIYQILGKMGYFVIRTNMYVAVATMSNGKRKQSMVTYYDMGESDENVRAEKYLFLEDTEISVNNVTMYKYQKNLKPVVPKTTHMPKRETTSEEDVYFEETSHEKLDIMGDTQTSSPIGRTIKDDVVIPVGTVTTASSVGKDERSTTPDSQLTLVTPTTLNQYVTTPISTDSDITLQTNDEITTVKPSHGGAPVGRTIDDVITPIDTINVEFSSAAPMKYDEISTISTPDHTTTLRTAEIDTTHQTVGDWSTTQRMNSESPIGRTIDNVITESSTLVETTSDTVSSTSAPDHHTSSGGDVEIDTTLGPMVNEGTTHATNVISPIGRTIDDVITPSSVVPEESSSAASVIHGEVTHTPDHTTTSSIPAEIDTTHQPTDVISTTQATNVISPIGRTIDDVITPSSVVPAESSPSAPVVQDEVTHTPDHTTTSSMTLEIDTTHQPTAAIGTTEAINVISPIGRTIDDVITPSSIHPETSSSTASVIHDEVTHTPDHTTTSSITAEIDTSHQPTADMSTTQGSNVISPIPIGRTIDDAITPPSVTAESSSAIPIKHEVRHDHTTTSSMTLEIGTTHQPTAGLITTEATNVISPIGRTIDDVITPSSVIPVESSSASPGKHDEISTSAAPDHTTISLITAEFESTQHTTVDSSTTQASNVISPIGRTIDDVITPSSVVPVESSSAASVKHDDVTHTPDSNHTTMASMTSAIYTTHQPTADLSTTQTSYVISPIGRTIDDVITLPSVVPEESSSSAPLKHEEITHSPDHTTSSSMSSEIDTTHQHAAEMSTTQASNVISPIGRTIDDIITPTSVVPEESSSASSVTYLSTSSAPDHTTVSSIIAEFETTHQSTVDSSTTQAVNVIQPIGRTIDEVITPSSVMPIESSSTTPVGQGDVAHTTDHTTTSSMTAEIDTTHQPTAGVITPSSAIPVESSSASPGKHDEVSTSSAPDHTTISAITEEFETTQHTTADSSTTQAITVISPIGRTIDDVVTPSSVAHPESSSASSLIPDEITTSIATDQTTKSAFVAEIDEILEIADLSSTQASVISPIGRTIDDVITPSSVEPLESSSAAPVQHIGSSTIHSLDHTTISASAITAEVDGTHEPTEYLGTTQPTNVISPIGRTIDDVVTPASIDHVESSSSSPVKHYESDETTTSDDPITSIKPEIDPYPVDTDLGTTKPTNAGGEIVSPIGRTIGEDVILDQTTPASLTHIPHQWSNVDFMQINVSTMQLLTREPRFTPIADECVAYSEQNVVLSQDDVISTGNDSTNFGIWSAWEFCPNGTFVSGVKGYSDKVDTRDDGVDHAGLTALGLVCQHPAEFSESVHVTNASQPSNLIFTSRENCNSYKWKSWHMCPHGGAATGFRASVQKYGGKTQDNIATENIEVLCSAGKASVAALTKSECDAHPPGEWQMMNSCEKGYAICGVQAQIQPIVSETSLQEYDNTGINNIRMKCCKVPSPMKGPIVMHHELVSAVNQVKSNSSHETVYTFHLPVGTHFKSHQLECFYNGMGYNTIKVQSELQQILGSIGAPSCTRRNCDIDWRAVSPKAYQDVRISTVHFNAPSGQKVLIYQIVGKVGDLVIKTNRYVAEIYADKKFTKYHMADVDSQVEKVVTFPMELVNVPRVEPNLPKCGYKSVENRHNANEILSIPLKIDNGIWGDWKQCPEGSFITGVHAFTNEVKQNTDSQGITSVGFQCSTPAGGITDEFGFVGNHLSNKNWTLYSYYSCNYGFGVGFQLSFLPDDHKQSEMGVDNVKLMCSCGPRKVKVCDSPDEGDWSPERVCKPKQALCGVRVQSIHHVEENGHETEIIDNIEMKCCDPPPPLQTCTTTEKVIPVGSCNNLHNAESAVCEFISDVGYSIINPSDKSLHFYSSIGYNMEENVEKVLPNLMKCNTSDCAYDWETASKPVWEKVTKATQALQMEKGSKLHVYQVVGECGFVRVKTNRFIFEEIFTTGKKVLKFYDF